MSNRIIYSRGFPYGAPLVMLRGGGLKRSGVKGYLRERGFRWDSGLWAWTTYLDRSELGTILCVLRDAYGCEIQPKKGMSLTYVIDLDKETVT